MKTHNEADGLNNFLGEDILLEFFLLICEDLFNGWEGLQTLVGPISGSLLINDGRGVSNTSSSYLGKLFFKANYSS